MALPHFARGLDIPKAQRRLSLAQAKLSEQIKKIDSERATLFRKGVAEASPRLQAHLARQIQRLSEQATALERVSMLIRKQSRILAFLVYAEENRDRPTGVLARVDWNGVLAEAGTTAIEQEQLDQQLDTILDVLGIPAPKPGPPVPIVTPPPPMEVAVVAAVPDGDGMKLSDHRRVRYVGIDAPEMTTWESDVPEPFAEEARALNRKLVLGKQVRLERDESDTDRYGRLLRYVYVDNVMVNAEMVRAGLAIAMSIWPDNKHADLLLRLEAEAKRKKRGMWKDA